MLYQIVLWLDLKYKILKKYIVMLTKFDKLFNFSLSDVWLH